MQKFDSINVIPFVDIMLVLLAIVLTTATFVSSGELQIALPEARATTSGQALEIIEIALDKSDVLYLDGQEVSLQDLEGQMLTMDKSALVTLKIDEKSEFSQFVSIVDTLKVIGFENLSIGTRKSL